MSQYQSALLNQAQEYVWEPHPVNVWITMEPHNALQVHIFKKLRERLEAQGCIFSHKSIDPTPLGPVAHIGIAFGRDLEEEVPTLERLGSLPKPRGMMLIINTVEQIPPGMKLFDLARGQLVRKSSQIGILAEGDLEGTHINRVLWASMPGNNMMLNGNDPEAIFDLLALRILAHASADKVNQYGGEYEAPYTWEEWAASPIHADLAHAARSLGAAGIIEDEVPLSSYATKTQVRGALRFLRRAALGEGMRSQLDLDLGVMGVTATGGNKINVSSDPMDGDILPVGQLSWDGYVWAVPKDCPIEFAPPSVETHENGMVYLASALINAGEVHSFESFLAYLDNHFSQHDRINVIPEGMRPNVTSIDHFHRQPQTGSIKEPGRVEVVYPDTEHFPVIDFPCGVREAELHLLSALFRSEVFTQPVPMGDKVVIAVMPGHGSVALYGGPRHELTDVLVNGMVMEEIVRI